MSGMIVSCNERLLTDQISTLTPFTYSIKHCDSFLNDRLDTGSTHMLLRVTYSTSQNRSMVF